MMTGKNMTCETFPDPVSPAAISAPISWKAPLRAARRIPSASRTGSGGVSLTTFLQEEKSVTRNPSRPLPRTFAQPFPNVLTSSLRPVVLGFLGRHPRVADGVSLGVLVGILVSERLVV